MYPIVFQSVKNVIVFKTSFKGDINLPKGYFLY